MSKRVLLLEPYDSVAEVIAILLDDLKYEAEIVTSGTIDENDLRKGDTVAFSLTSIRTGMNGATMA